MKWRWVIILIPLLIGGFLAMLMVTGNLPNPILVTRMDAAVLMQLCGMGVAVLLAAWFSLVEWTNRIRKETREKTEASALEERRRFLQRLDHELKNPITAIQAGAANVTSPDDQAVANSIKVQSQRLSRLVGDLRKLSDLETRSIESAPVDLSEILSQVVELFKEQSPDAGHHLTLSIPQAPWPLPEVVGDKDLLLLAFHNLVDNAEKFSAPGDHIEIRAYEDNNQVVVEVADTGPGIPEEELPHIWEELYRGEGARGIQGSGLGLALVRSIIDRHHGQVAIRSRLQQGTVVTVRLPSIHQVSVDETIHPRS